MKKMSFYSVVAIIFVAAAFTSCKEDEDRQPPLSYTVDALPDGILGIAYSQNIGTAVGAEDISYAVTESSLPAGLSLSTAGMLTGTPTVAADNATFSVTASAKGYAAATEQFSITIFPVRSGLYLNYGENNEEFINLDEGNIVKEAFYYLTMSSLVGAYYTLALTADVSCGRTVLENPNVNLTIIGIGSRRTIKFTEDTDDSMMFWIKDGSLTLGNNITLRGKGNGANMVFVGSLVSAGSLTMLEGSEITGHTSILPHGSVLIQGENSNFTMEGGAITGNRSTGSFISVPGIGGVVVQLGATFIMNGGSITGNNPADVFIDPSPPSANFIHNGGDIGKLYP